MLPELYKSESWRADSSGSNRWAYNYRYPIRNGYATDWDDMEKLWHLIFYNELKVTSSEHPIILTETPFNPKSHREKIAQIMFETFDVPALYIAVPAVLSLASSAKCTGMVIDLGHDLVWTVPIYELYALRQEVNRIDHSGSNLNIYLAKIMHEHGKSINWDIAQDIKEKLCYVALDFQEEMTKPVSGECEKLYQMPNGSSIALGKERFMVQESLFNPELAGRDMCSIIDIACRSIESCDSDIRK